MEIVAIIISTASLVIIGFLFLKISAFKPEAQSDKAVEMIQKQMEEIRGSIGRLYPDLTQTLQNVDKNVNSRLDNAAKVIGDVQKQLGEVHAATKQVQESQKDISTLQDILRAPKIRGGMGELFLSDLLAQVLPPDRYQLQYRFKSGEAVDAVVIFKNGKVPIDSKFPLESFTRLISATQEADKLKEKKEFIKRVKIHIDAIAQKYILPDEDTFPFALMYIPAENVYYETIIKDENFGEDKGIFHYAISKKVLPVSPNSFYAYLQTIIMGLRGMHIEERAQEILKNLAQLEGDFVKIMDDFGKMGTHLKNLAGSYDSTDKRLSKLSDKLSSLENKEPLPLLT